MWIGSSTSEVILRQKRRPSEFETFHPFTTFHSSLSSVVVEGSMTLSSWRPRGKRPGDTAPIIPGDWRGLRSVPAMLGEYCWRLMIVRGMCVGDAWVGK